MNPRTFLKPNAVAIAALPEVGRKAPAEPPTSGWPTLLIFLRHPGCPFAEATLRQLRQLAAERRDVNCVAVAHGQPEPGRKWCQAIGGIGSVRWIEDPERKLYGAWGLGLTSLGLLILSG